MLCAYLAATVVIVACNKAGADLGCAVDNQLACLCHPGATGDHDSQHKHNTTRVEHLRAAGRLQWEETLQCGHEPVDSSHNVSY